MEAAKNLPIWEGRARASGLLIGAASLLFRLSQPHFPSLPTAFPPLPTASPLLPTAFPLLPTAFPPHLPSFLPFPIASPPLPTTFSSSRNHIFRSSQPLFPPHLPGFLPRLIRFWCRTNANFPLRGPKNHLLWGISELQYPCFCPFMGEKQLLSDFSAHFSVSRFLVFKSLYNRFLCSF